MKRHLVMILADVESDDVGAVRVVAERFAQQVRHRLTHDGGATVAGVAAEVFEGMTGAEFAMAAAASARAVPRE